MTTPPVRYGDKVVTVADQFASLVSGQASIKRQVNLLTIVIALHLMGVEWTSVLDLLKRLGSLGV